MQKNPPVIILDYKEGGFCGGERVVCGKSLLEWQKEDLEKRGFETVAVEVRGGSGDPVQTNELAMILETYLKNFAGAEEFFVVTSTAMPMGFVLEEMLEFTAEAVVAGVQTSDYGGRRVLMTGVVRQGRIRKILPKTTTVTDEMRDLLAVYKLSKNFVRFARKQNSEFSLVDTLALFARDHVIKICEVSNEVVDRCVGENDLWKLAKNLLISIPMTVGENVVIAPTAVLKGRVILADRAVVDDLAIIEGPAYVGVGSKVGRFCNILPETILESGVQVGTYAEVSSSMVAAGSKIESRTTIYDQILEAGLGETKNQPRKRG